MKSQVSPQLLEAARTGLLPPAIIVGGSIGSLSIARSLHAAGVQVYAINHPGSPLAYSRCCRCIEINSGGTDPSEAWAAFLLGPESDHLFGAVLLAAADDAIELIAAHRQELAERFILDISNPEAQMCMLDKLRTYRAAEAAGVPTPRFWVADNEEELEAVRHELVFPLIVKPVLGHTFSRKFTGTYAVVANFPELRAALDALRSAQIRAFLVEMIPGPDDQLCSYYTYMAEDGRNLLDFTKRVIRRYPLNMGGSTYHITDQVPEVKELSLALFSQVDLRGVANAEFKLDRRDGKLKLIECNARFTAADRLLVASGLNLPLFVYGRLTGFPQTAPSDYRLGLRLWKPAADFAAFRQLNRLGALSFGAWISSIMHPQVFAIFCWSDPLPSIVSSAHLLSELLSRCLLFLRSRKYRGVPSGVPADA